MTISGFKIGLLSTIAGVAVAGASASHAGGFYLQEQSIRAVGRAFSGEVADQGSASLWWNPASVGGLEGGSAHLGLSAILPKGNVDNVNTLIVRPGQAPQPVGGEQRSKNPINNGFLPTGAVAYGIAPNVAIGFAVTSPFSFTTNYDSDSWARYTADKTRIRTFDFQPSIAVVPVEGLSLGVAANIQYAKATLSNYLPNLAPGSADGRLELKGDGFGYGWSAGAQYSTGPVTLGVSYKSAIKHVLKGSITTEGLVGNLAPQNGEQKTSATFNTPWQLNMGARVRVTDQLTLNGQVVRFGWSKFDAIYLGAPLNSAIPENYRNTWSFAGGIDYDINPAWTVRAGVQRDKSPTYNGERDARVPDSDRWNIAVGASHAVSDMFTIDAAANYVLFKDANINRPAAAYAGSPVQTPIIVDGRLRNANALVLSIGGRMSF